MLLPILVPFLCVVLLDELLDPYPVTKRIMHFNNISLKYIDNISVSVRQWLPVLIINILLLQQEKSSLGPSEKELHTSK